MTIMVYGVLGSGVVTRGLPPDRITRVTDERPVRVYVGQADDSGLLRVNNAMTSWLRHFVLLTSSVYVQL